jgi:dTMP kinase
MLTKLISFEGIDGSGKSTQAKLLADFFNSQNLNVKLVTFPDTKSRLGRLINEAIYDESCNPYALQLLFAADRVGQIDSIASAPQKYDVVITDRYKWSSYVYGTAKGLPANWLLNLEQTLRNPDIVFLLDLDPSISRLRTKGQDMFEKELSLQSKCRTEYLKLAKDNEFYRLVDATQSISDIQTFIIQTLKRNTIVLH